MSLAFYHTTPEKTLSNRVSATPAALDLIQQLSTRYGDVIFHQSGGCCDGSAPMMFLRQEFPLGNSDVKLGRIGGVDFYMSKSQFEYWEHTHLTIDVVKGHGGMFSLEGATGQRFLTRSRLYSDEEFNALPPIE